METFQLAQQRGFFILQYLREWSSIAEGEGGGGGRHKTGAHEVLPLQKKRLWDGLDKETQDIPYKFAFKRKIDSL